MTDSEQRCGHPKDDGEPCPTPIALCSSCGRCRSHCAYSEACDYSEEQVRAARSKGARARNAKARGDDPAGLEPDELPPLKDHDAAKSWLEVIGRAVTTGRLGNREAQAAIRAVHTWLNAEAEQVTREELDELRSAVERLQDEVGDGRLEVA